MQSRRGLAIRLGGLILSTVALYSAVQFAQLVAATQQARRDEARLQADVNRLQTAVAGLETALEQTGTDEYVEGWAREEQKWVQSGDQVVVPIPATDTAGAASTQSEQGAEGAWQRFRRWLGF